MALDPIQVQLSLFEKVQILRDQLQERQKELKDVEANIHELQRALASQRYLESLSPYYSMQAKNESGPTPDEVNALEQRRNLLVDLIHTIESELPALLEAAEKGETGPQASPAPQLSSAPGAPARKAKFDF